MVSNFERRQYDAAFQPKRSIMFVDFFHFRSKIRGSLDYICTKIYINGQDFVEKGG